MGHRVGKDIYRRLGRKIDGLSMRSPWNRAFQEILTTLYTPEEADVLVKMPFSPSPFPRVRDITNYEEGRLRKILEGMCEKGLVMDLLVRETRQFMPSPMVVGLFEFTMMRTGDGADPAALAKLFHEYLQSDEEFTAANCEGDVQFPFIRTLPHEGAIKESPHVEVLDYEKASALIGEADRFAIGKCSCRHAMSHGEGKKCDVPLGTCSQFGFAADLMIRHGFAREVSQGEMLDNLARSRELGLVLSADNVQRNVTFLCHCCSCCCHVLLGISKFWYPDIVVTSSLIAESDAGTCKGCGLCAKACPIGAVEMTAVERPEQGKKKKKPRFQAGLCLGCGVCALRCKSGALKLVKRGQRVLHPETTFERIMLQSLEKGTLQNQLFDDPGSLTDSFMRAFVGGFLRLPPVKRALVSDTLRSSFLWSLKKGAGLRGQGWLLDL